MKSALYAVEYVLVKPLTPGHCSQAINSLIKSQQLLYEHGNHELQDNKGRNNYKRNTKD